MRRRKQPIAALTALTLLACTEDPQRETPPPQDDRPLIEFRMVHDTAGPGLERVEHGGEVLYLAPRPVASDGDLRVVRAEVRDTGLMLELDFDAEGGRRLQRVTGENIGRRMALVLDGRVQSALVIRDRVGGRMSWAVDVAQDEAQRLAELIRARWPEGVA